MKNKRIMVIVAHPDDCEIATGGTIYKFLRHGFDVKVIVMTKGESGNGINKAKTRLVRKKEALLSSKYLGYDLDFMNISDGKVLPLIKYRKKLIKSIRKYKPSIIITHKSNDYHPDHRYTSILVQDTLVSICNEAICPNVKALDYTPITLLILNRFDSFVRFDDKIIIDIEDVMGIKTQCLSFYKSQLDEQEIVHIVYNESSQLAKFYADKSKEKYNCYIRYAEGYEICQYAKENELNEFKQNINEFIPF